MSKPHPAKVAGAKQRFWKKHNQARVLDPDPIIDRSPAQKDILVNKASIELAELGYSVVRTDWLKSIISQNTKADPRWKWAAERGAVVA